MNIYILKVYEIEATGTEAWQPDYIKETYRSEESAQRMANYWSNEHRMNVLVQENYIECPVINGTVFVPENVY